MTGALVQIHRRAEVRLLSLRLLSLTFMLVVPNRPLASRRHQVKKPSYRWDGPLGKTGALRWQDVAVLFFWRGFSFFFWRHCEEGLEDCFWMVAVLCNHTWRLWLVLMRNKSHVQNLLYDVMLWTLQCSFEEHC
jgi:hypothetical protein